MGNQWVVSDDEEDEADAPSGGLPAGVAQPAPPAERKPTSETGAEPEPPKLPKNLSEPSSLKSLPEGGSWLSYVLPTVLFLACIIAGACVLAIRGSDADSAFRCDIAAAALSGSTFAFFVGLLVLEVAFSKEHVSALRWLAPLQLILGVNAVGLLALALLGHATWVLVQIFAVLAASCWTLLCCYITYLLWRLGIPAPPEGETNFMRALGNAPRITAVLLWLLFCAGGAASMYFKPLDKVGFDPVLGRFEHFLMLALGGIWISSLCTWPALLLLRSGRRLLLLRDETPADLSYCQMIFRSFVLAAGTHIIGLAILAFTFTWVIVILAICMAKLAVRGAQMPLSQELPMEETQSIRLNGRVKKRTCTEKSRDCVLTILVLLLAALRVVAVFLIFFFDLTFIQSYMVGTRQREFILVAHGQGCGTQGALLSDNVADPAACTALAVESKDGAFLFGVGGGEQGRCYAQTLQVDIDSYTLFKASGPSGNTSCPSTGQQWQDYHNYDFYVLAPSCSVQSRRLLAEDAILGEADAEVDDGRARRLRQEEKTTTYKFNFPMHIGQAAGNMFGDWLEKGLDGFLNFLRSVMNLGNVGIPQGLNLQCTGFRRMISACMVLGAVMTVAVLSSMDLLSIMAASYEIAKVRAAREESFKQYLYMITRAACLQQMVLLMLQVTVSWGAKLVWEAAGIFAQHCGYLIHEGHLSGTACPNAWHPFMDIVSAVMLFSGIVLGTLTFFSVMSGTMYGLLPARWAVKAIFGAELHVEHFGETVVSGEDRPRSDSVESIVHAVEMPQAPSCRWTWLLRPFMGLGVSFGVWTTSFCRNYRCSRRQDWYQPCIADDADDDDPRASGELVDFKCIYEATSHNISMVWLPVPAIGAIMSKGAMYLNQNVIFAFGEDSGGTGRKPQRMIAHFQEDTPRMVHILHWAFSACLFFMIMAINCDFFGVEENARLVVLSVCLAVVFIIAVMKVVVDLVKELRVFRQGKSLIKCCKRVIEDLTYEEGTIVQIWKYGKGESDVNPLKDLPNCERKHLIRVLQAAKDLEELSWVRERRLPPDVMSRLVTAKNALGSRSLKRLLEQGDEEEASGDPHRHAVLLAGTVLYIHQAVYQEICAHRSRAAAQKRAYRAAQDAAAAVGKELEQTATAQACAQAAAIAAIRVRENEEKRKLAQRQTELRPVGSQAAAEPPELPRRLCVEFEACTKGTARVGAHMSEEHGGRELIEPQLAEVVVIVSGKVELTWPRGKDAASFTAADVQMKAVRHQIVGHPDMDHLAQGDGEDEAEQGSPVGDIMTARPSWNHGGDQWLCGLCVQEDSWSHASCQCLLAPLRKPNRTIVEGDGAGKIWQLTDMGIYWESAAVSSSPSDGGSDNGGSFGMQELRGSGAASSFRVRRMSPPPLQYSLRENETEQPTQDIIGQLEAALRDSVNNPQTLALAAAFMSALGSDRRHMGNEQADRCSRLMAVASKILRAQQRRQSTTRKKGYAPAVEFVEPALAARRHNTPIDTAPVDMRISALEALREALAREDVSSDDLSFAIERARRADVDPMILSKAEEKFRVLIWRQRASLRLIKAVESRMIQPLRSAIEEAEAADIQLGDFPDKNGVGVLRKAKQVLKEEEDNVLQALKDAVRIGGALQLRRSLQQVGAMGVGHMSSSEAEEIKQVVAEAENKLTAVGEKKRLIALLKMALTTGNAGLLKAAVEECERSNSATPDTGVCLDQAKKRLETLENANDKFKDGVVENLLAEVGGCTITPSMMMKDTFSTTLRRRSTASSPTPAQPRVNQRDSSMGASSDQVQASVALRAALYQEPPELQMLRLALKQAKQVGLGGDDVVRAEELILSLIDQEKALDGVRKAAAERDVGDLSAAINHCHEIGVDGRKLLSAVQQLMEDQAKVARVAGDHGLGSSVLADLERERRELHNSILDAHGGLRCFCRIRPEVPSDPPPLRMSNAPPLYERGDRHTLLVAQREGAAASRAVRFSTVYPPDAIQAEVFNDLRGLAQSAIDGYNVLIMAGGPPGSGKTFSMYGESSERKGIAPRIIDELFSIRDRDSWRANLEVDAQVVEVNDTRKISDLLSRGAGRPGLGPSVRLVPQGVGSWDAPSSSKDRQMVVVDGAVTRRAASRHELKKMVQDAIRGASGSGKARHLVLLVTLTRTNRATGTMTRSKLALADLAGLAQTSGPDVTGSYRALESVFKALARAERRPPFRDHALTQVLQDCLGGSAKTVLLLALPPPDAARSSIEIMDALNFATCATW